MGDDAGRQGGAPIRCAGSRRLDVVDVLEPAQHAACDRVLCASNAAAVCSRALTGVGWKWHVFLVVPSAQSRLSLEQLTSLESATTQSKLVACDMPPTPTTVHPVAPTTVRRRPPRRKLLRLRRVRHIDADLGRCGSTPGRGGDRRASPDTGLRQDRALPLRHSAHGTLQSPFCFSCNGGPPVLRTSTMSPGTENP
jgi:hypothetical protein